MSDKVPPALKPEEWAQRGVNGLAYFEGEVLEVYGEGGGDCYDCDPTAYLREPTERHALAALCLHDQSFGFTWEDVDALREPGGWECDHDENRLRSIGDRIAALLPPRDG